MIRRMSHVAIPVAPVPPKEKLIGEAQATAIDAQQPVDAAPVMGTVVDAISPDGELEPQRPEMPLTTPLKSVVDEKEGSPGESYRIGGYRVVYGDDDSVTIGLGSAEDGEEVKRQASVILRLSNGVMVIIVKAPSSDDEPDLKPEPEMATGADAPPLAAVGADEAES